MASVTVVGTARSSVRPDRATLDLGLTNVAPASTTAMDDVARRSHILAGHLAELGFDDRSWATQGVSLDEEWEWKNETNTLTGYRATTGITVEIVDLDQIGPLVQVAVDDAGAQVRSLVWRVAHDHPAREALLGDAAIDARRRATAYVLALGLGLGAVEEISDLPIAGGSRSQPMAAGAAMFAKSADRAAPMQVNAGEIELTASVSVRFGTVTGR